MWADNYFTNLTTKRALGVPEHVNFTALNPRVNDEFLAAGDL